MSFRTLRASLRRRLSAEVDDGIIAVNTALQLGRRTASRADKLNAAERLQRVRPISWDQRDAFLEIAARERPYGTLFAILTKAGLRPGEAFALRPAILISGSARSGRGRGSTLDAYWRDTRSNRRR